MELFSLRCFVTVARLGSFSRAADELFRTQPAVSLQIRKLEKEVGQQLFDRAHRSPVMTDAGRALAAGARDLLERLDMLPELIASSGAELAGSLTIASNLSLISHFLPRALREFHRRFPRVQLRLLNRTSRGIGRAVEEREADVGIGFLLDDQPDSTVAVVDTSPLVLVARRDAPAVADRRVSLEKILSGPLVHFEEGIDLRRHVERALLRAGKLAPAIELPSIESILEFVSYGFGASILPAFAISPYWRKRLVVRGLGKSVEPLKISSCTHRRHPLSRAAAAFLAPMIRG
ncbi:MAG TPA: LysR family transcriptional regulator [Spirochaetia bacterium]|nr:LysR family transcriptional regulator [Spirochaetia bacterium]